MPADEHQAEDHGADAEDKRARMLAGLLPKRRVIMDVNAPGSRLSEACDRGEAPAR